MPNFAVTEFSEVRLLEILRTSPFGHSAKFAGTEFSEVHPPCGGHIVCLKRKMVKTAAAQMAKRLIKNGTTERRLNLSNGSSLRALSTASSATLASMAATHAIER